MNMSNMSRRTLAIGACILAATLAVWGISMRTSDLPLAVTHDPVVTGAAGTGAEKAPSVAAGITAPASAKYSQPLLTRYNSGDNVRALVEYALRHPQEGGNFYASRLLAQCRGTTLGNEALNSAQLPYAGQTDYAERSEAASRLSRRCEGLLQEEIGIGRDREIWAEGERQGDPLVRAVNDYSAATRGFKEGADAADARRNAMREVIATQDPLLIEDLSMRLSLYVDTNTGRKYFWFAGRSYPLDSDVDVGGALYILPCGLGLTCDKAEFTTAMRCASGGGCDASRFDYLRRTYEARPGTYEKVIALHAAMLDAVKSGNVGAFVR